MTPEYDICIIDDDGDYVRLIGADIESLGFTWIGAMSGKSGLDLILQHRPKVILCDWIMPEVDGMALLRLVRDDDGVAATYFIMMTAYDTPTREYEALEAGADDYVTKPVHSRELAARLRVGMRVWEMQYRLQHAAITDGLTGLYNHDHLNRILECEWTRSRRYGAPLSLIMMDIDHFKAVNDTYGHLVGNDVLEGVADILRNATRGPDFVGRFGGDEFAVVAPESTIEDAAALAERIRLNVHDLLHIPALQGYFVTASLGVACADDARVRSAPELVELADRAMYISKRAGRNRVSTTLDIDDENGRVAAMIQTEDVEALRKQVAVLSVQTKQVYVQSIGALVQALEEKDPNTAKHSINVSRYAEQIAWQIGGSESLAESVRNAGLLHDIGKVGIPDRILMKPTSLTELEQTVMHQVPLMSTRIIDHLLILESELQIIRHQWERFDGTGYPAGLHGEQIPIGSRILLVADAFDSMTTDRVYRQRSSIEDALDELKRCTGTQFDPRVVHAVRQLVAQDRRCWQDRIDETIESFRLFAPSGFSRAQIRTG